MIYKVMPDELYHYGTLGMKWGIRRYQNPDGSLTPLGRERARKLENAYDARTRKRNKDGSRIDVETDKKANKIKEDYDLLTNGKSIIDKLNRHSINTSDGYFNKEELDDTISKINLQVTLEAAKNNLSATKAKYMVDKAAVKAAKLDAKIAIAEKKKRLNELNQYEKNKKVINEADDLNKQLDAQNKKKQLKEAKKSDVRKFGEEVGKEVSKKIINKATDAMLDKAFKEKEETYGDLIKKVGQTGVESLTAKQAKDFYTTRNSQMTTERNTYNYNDYLDDRQKHGKRI